MTLPKVIREKLQLEKGSHLIVYLNGEEIILKKAKSIVSLSDEDPIWEMIGMCKYDKDEAVDVAENHDKYLAEGEIERWRKSWEEES
jgi:transcriptional pleiotropic regulator of transition state genes